MKILRRGPWILLDIVTKEDVNKGGMCWYEPVTICIDLHLLLERSGCPLFNNRALCDDGKKCAIRDLTRGYLPTSTSSVIGMSYMIHN